MSPTALIFDLDGTLVNSISDLTGALNEAHGALGLRPLRSDETRRIVGDGARVLVTRSLALAGGDPALLERALALFMRAYVSAPAEHTKIYPGVESTLGALAAAGVRLGVCTNKPWAPAADLLRRLDLARYFRSLVGGDTLPQRKPDPAPALLSLRELGAEAREAVFVGDSGVDVATARAAGLRVVAVSYGYAQVPAEALGADALIHHFSELPGALARLAP